MAEEFQKKLDKIRGLENCFWRVDAGTAKRIPALFFRTQTIQNPGGKG
jgi:hypothetical protein